MNLEKFLALLEHNPGSPLHLMLPDESFLPAHFHVTEVGRVQKDFLDCGGTARSTTSCVLQVWVANDIAHRLESTKLAKILRLAAPLFANQRISMEVEYETTTISTFAITEAEATPAGILIHLAGKHTACLAPDRCGVGLELAPCCTSNESC